MCVFRDSKNLERFYVLTQTVICLVISQLKELNSELLDESRGHEETAAATSDSSDLKKKGCDDEETSETWTADDREKLFIFMSKLFLINFPLYQVSRGYNTIYTLRKLNIGSTALVTPAGP